MSADSSTPLSAAEEAQIRERCEKATPGDWVTDDREPRMVLLSHDLRSSENIIAVTWQSRGPFGPTETTPDADFIAHAREDLPRLLVTLTAEREARERAEKEWRQKYLDMVKIGTMHKQYADAIEAAMLPQSEESEHE